MSALKENLKSNATMASPSSLGKRVIAIVAALGCGVVLTVSCGLDESDSEAVFDPFVSATSQAQDSGSDYISCKPGYQIKRAPMKYDTATRGAAANPSKTGPVFHGGVFATASELRSSGRRPRRGYSYLKGCRFKCPSSEHDRITNPTCKHYPKLKSSNTDYVRKYPDSRWITPYVDKPTSGLIMIKNSRKKTQAAGECANAYFSTKQRAAAVIAELKKKCEVERVKIIKKGNADRSKWFPCCVPGPRVRQKKSGSTLPEREDGERVSYDNDDEYGDGDDEGSTKGRQSSSRSDEEENYHNIYGEGEDEPEEDYDAYAGDDYDDDDYDDQGDDGGSDGGPVDPVFPD